MEEADQGVLPLTSLFSAAFISAIETIFVKIRVRPGERGASRRIEDDRMGILIRGSPSSPVSQSVVDPDSASPARSV